MTSEHDAVLVTKAAYEADGPAWAARWQDKGFLGPHFQRFKSLLGNGGRVLDLGCGPGIDAGLLASMGLDVTGLDLTRAMLEVARGRGELRRLLQGDSRRLPIRGEAFDGVWASASLLHLPKDQVDAALSEVRWVLRPGGVFYSAMKIGAHDGLMTRDQRGGGNPVRGDRHFSHYQTVEWSRHLRDADFELVGQQCENLQAAPPETPWLTTYALAGAAQSTALSAHALVRGRVQRVGFRIFVERRAAALELTGLVRNLDDGSVEVIAEGPLAQLDDLVSDLHRGPRSAVVESLDITWRPASRGYDRFGVAP